MGSLIHFKNFIADSLTNLVNGLGGNKDPRTGYVYNLTLLDRVQLEYAYRGDWLARKIVDAPAEDATREWREWRASPEQIEKLEEAERKLDLRRRMRRALSKARLYGGAAIVMGIANQGKSDTPVDIELVKEGDLKFLAVFHQYELVAAEKIKDIDSEWFGQPEYYTLATNAVGTDASADLSQGVKIHPSRVIPLIGNELPDDTLLAQNGNMWGDSVLQVVDEALKQAGAVIGGVAGLVVDAKMDVIKMPNLTAQLADEEASKGLITRFTRAQQLKSSNSLLLIDAKEEWERIQTQFASFPPLVQQYLTISCGAAGIPVTRILGDSKGGLGGGESGGQSDIRNYYDDVSSMQKNELSPTLTPLDHVFIRSTLGTFDEQIYYEWTPLWQLSDKEKADIATQKAAATKTYNDTGLINPDALREAVISQLTEDGVYPGLEDALDEFGSEPEEPVIGPDQINEHIGMMQKSANDLTRIGTHAVNNNASLAKRLAPKPKPAAKKPVKDEQYFAFYPDGSKREIHDAEPRSLYVRRDVLNAATIRRWAKAQGFDTVMPADEMHVTICYSKSPVDWMKMGNNYNWGDKDSKLVVPAGGPRMLEMFGPERDVVVLLFTHDDLKWRHARFKEEGASFDWPEYQPHITITMKKPEGMDITKVEPYQGPIILGPEIFEEIKQGAMEKVVEDEAFIPDFLKRRT